MKRPPASNAALESAQAAQASAESTADALKTSEIRYRRLFETSDDGIFILDSEHVKMYGGSSYVTGRSFH